MTLDPSTIEADLRRLRPAALDDSLLARLDACAEDSWKELDPADIALEKRLRGIAAARPSAGLTASLEAVLAGVRFPNEEKIVPFPTNESAPTHGSRGWWSAAAAVAIVGALAALLVPQRHENTPVAKVSPPAGFSRPAIANNELIPAGFNRGLSEASDEGVIWQSNNQPHRVLKVVYMDKVTLKDSEGRTIEVEQPRVEYILVPAKTD